MQLTLHTDYSFRVLIFLYAQAPNPATVAQISQFYGISRHHLLKVVNNLGHKGLVETLRGKGGGVRLRQRALEMSAGQMLRELEDSRPLVNCQGTGKTPVCAVLPVCRFNGVLNHALDRFYEELDGYHLADLVKADPQFSAGLLAASGGG